MIKGLSKLNEYGSNFKNKLDKFLKIMKVSVTGIALAVVLVGCEHSTDMNVNKGLSNSDYVDIKTNLDKYYIVKDNGDIIYESKDSLSSEYKNSNYVINSSYPNLIISKKITDKSLLAIENAKKDLESIKESSINENLGVSKEFINAAIEDQKVIFIKESGEIDYLDVTDSEVSKFDLKYGDIAFENKKLNTLYQNKEYELLISEMNNEYPTEEIPQHTHSGSSNMLLWYMIYSNMLQQNHNSMAMNHMMSSNLYNNSTMQYHTSKYSIADNVDRYESKVFRNPDNSTVEKSWNKTSRTTGCCSS